MIRGEFIYPRHSLDLELTLMSGQAFRWHRDAEDWWSCLLAVTDGPNPGADLLLRVRQDGDVVSYQGNQPATRELLASYFRLEIDVRTLQSEFQTVDPALAVAMARFPGLRVLRQDPVEALFSFICTSASPLHRIRRGITGLCRNYGGPPVDVSGAVHFRFPTVEALAEAEVDEMRMLGLGYRARYLQAAARRVLDRGGAAWLRSLRVRPYDDAKAALVSLPGVGEKIADCVCLFSLDKDAAIPVDTHVRRIAGRDYGVGKDARSLTPAVYAQIGDALRARFGPMAGWAQQYLFFNELYGQGAWAAYQALYR